MQMRRMFEPFSAGLAALNHTPEQLAHLTSCYERMARSSSLDDWIAADLTFHEAILAASGNELLVPLGNMIREGLRILFTVSANNASDSFYSLPLHKDVLDAITARDPVAANAKMVIILDRSDETMNVNTRQG
jgi:DNA-binding FadR family transcriptional regulator